MAFTAIVVTRNSACEVPGLIESFERHLPATCGLLFVDNASTDGTVEAIRRSSSRASVMVLASNVGFGPANNAGVRAAQSEVVALLNPDTLIVDRSLDGLAALAAQERALFAPRLLNQDGSVQISARAPLASWEAGLISVWPGGLMPARIRMRCEPWRYERRLAAGWLSAACLVARRELLLEFGPFDERLVMYGEDGDLCLRAWRAGVPSIAASDIARVVHLGGRSASQTFTDSGMQRKIEARWWVVHERLGRLRGLYDLWIQAVGHALRWTARTIGGRDTEVNSAWLRGFARAVRAGRPPRPQALTSARPVLGTGSGRGRSSGVGMIDQQVPQPVPRSRRVAQMKRPRWVRNGWFATRYLLGSHDATFPLLRLAPEPYARVMVERGMDVCIEGLPRSANTFGGWAFLSQNPDTRLAHHVHLPMQFQRAVRFGVPCVVLIREPLSNLTSLVIAGENDLSHELAYRIYIHYFRRLLSVCDQLALCTFDEVLDDPSVLASRLNARFGTSFRADSMRGDQKQLVVERLERHQEGMRSRPAHGTLPNEYKDRLKPALRAALAGHRLRPSAEALYANLAGVASARSS